MTLPIPGRPDVPRAAHYYEPLGDGRYRSTAATVGPWSPDLQHGSPPASLLAHVLARTEPQPGARLSRIAYDFFGVVPVGELRVVASVLRPGKRIALLEATAYATGPAGAGAAERPVMRATAWRILAESGRSPEVSDGLALPALPPPAPQSFFRPGESFGYGESLEWRFAEGAFDALGPATVWTRLGVSIVAGEPVAPLEQILAMVDSQNGVSAVIPYQRYAFVPVELSVSVFRHPESAWVGMSAATTLGADGIGACVARLFDERGTLGHSQQTLFVSPR